MNRYLSVLFLIILSITTGCASLPEPVAFSAPLEKDAKIGIIIAQPHEAAAQYTGSIGLLDLAIISAANGKLNDHLKTLTFDEYYKIPGILKDSLESKGYTVSISEQQLSAKLAQKYKLPSKGISKNLAYYQKYPISKENDYLIVVRTGAMGTTRPYYGPVPQTDPLVNVNLIAEFVNLKTGKVHWYRLASKRNTIPGNWKEEGYPTLTKAFYEALDQAIYSLKVDLDQQADSTAQLTQ